MLTKKEKCGIFFFVLSIVATLYATSFHSTPTFIGTAVIAIFLAAGLVLFTD